VHHFIRCLLLASILFAGAASASVDDTFLAARDAYGRGKMDKFSHLSAKVPASYPLRLYLDFWQIKSRSASADEMAKFAVDHSDSPLSERILQDLARFYGKNEDWADYRPVSEKLTSRSQEITCYDLRARLARGDQTAVNEGLGVWLTAQDLPTSCDPLFTTLANMSMLTDGIRVARLRLALEAGNVSLARHLVTNLEKDSDSDLSLLDQASRSPEKTLAAASGSDIQKEIILYALSRLAQKDQDQAAQTWNARLADFSEADQRYGWGVIALAAARQLNPKAVSYFLLAKDQLSDTQNVWKARTMLRAGRWLDVYASIVTMPGDMQNEPVWRYWKARALLAMNLPARANPIFAQLSHEIHYYGLLANEELPESLENQPVNYQPSPAEIKEVNQRIGLKRALLLHSLELNVDAAAEWNWSIRGFDDHELLAAAELARQNQWYDQAIRTAEQTQTTHNMDLRYLTPYKDLADTYSEKNGLDPAWVYGLMRQESHFVDYARSSVGARGLMQIMPATGRWIAKLMGLGRREHARIADPDVNIKFGTFYLKRLLNSLDNSAVLATAGYNAGPGRARKWQASVPLEGAIYTESIPIPETREYVKKVLANAMYYSQRLGLHGDSLKERLGIIPAQTAAPVGSGTNPNPDAGN